MKEHQKDLMYLIDVYSLYAKSLQKWLPNNETQVLSNCAFCNYTEEKLNQDSKKCPIDKNICDCDHETKNLISDLDYSKSFKQETNYSVRDAYSEEPEITKRIWSALFVKLNEYHRYITANLRERYSKQLDELEKELEQENE